ncbi:hypothetical protein DEHRE_06990 [Dehalobacter restrictus DSM 9455]|uniref:Uncharacterized protein n=1 Tax=Dehalobacter restrictus (strain DSM 9455 / PER-K23) TaxID=871738 RepID=A0ABN4C0B0_DEHRP|nr:hypothetical protein DEHRE_06990 [Dehalobacter restrictus DSM 9455]
MSLSRDKGLFIFTEDLMLNGDHASARYHVYPGIQRMDLAHRFYQGWQRAVFYSKLGGG